LFNHLHLPDVLGMWGKNSTNKYLIVLIIILAIGTPTAYAISITLGADPIIVLGILDMMNNRIINVGSPFVVAGDITADTYFDSANTQTGIDATALGGTANIASGGESTVGGGNLNRASGFGSTIAGGDHNLARETSATIAGGSTNTASGFRSTVGGGFFITSSGVQSTVGGGSFITASGADSTVGGGRGNIAGAGSASTVGGGSSNIASGASSTIPGGEQNEASGDYSFAAGRRAHAVNNGAFVWGDSTNADITSSQVDQFTVRAAGGSRIFSNAGLTTGVLLAPGSNAWAGISDYRLKDNIAEYSVLDKLDDYRAVEFDWKAGGNHDVGVMAQELQSIFPELVNTGSSEGDITNAADSGVWSVQYSKLGALALQAIKEQQKIIDSLISIICEDNPDREICLEN